MADKVDLISAVLVPGLQALVTGAVGAGAVGASWQAWRNPSAGWVFVAAFADLVALAWLWLVLRWVAYTLPGPEPAPAAPRAVAFETVRVMVGGPSEAFARGAFLDLPLSKAELAAVGKVVAGGGDFSMATLAGRGKPLSRAQFELLRSALIARDLCEWVNPAAHAQGCQLTRAGRGVLVHFAPPAPPVRAEPAKPVQGADPASARGRAGDQARPVDQAPTSGVLPADPMARFRGAAIKSRAERAARLAAADPGGRPGR